MPILLTPLGEFVDITQCSIPVFDGLLPSDHGDRLLDILFVFAYWHALAKLRLHTDDTLSILDDWTTVLGEQSRAWAAHTADSFQTKELRREYEARKRRQARASAQQKKRGTKTRRPAPSPKASGDPDAPGSSAVHPNTYRTHSG